jgi:hypothetical protein
MAELSAHSTDRVSSRVVAPDDHVLVLQLQEALRTRATIEQAKGILMGTRRCSAAEAFAILRRLSNVSNQKLHDIAADLIREAQRDSGRSPTSN